MGDLRTELGTTGVIGLNDTNVRTLCGKPSGQIALSDCHCKSNVAWSNTASPMPNPFNLDVMGYGSSRFVTNASGIAVRSYTRWNQTNPADYSSHYAYCDGQTTTSVAASSINQPYVTMIHGRLFYATGNFKIHRIRVKSWHKLYNTSSGSQIAMSMYARYKVLYSTDTNVSGDRYVKWTYETAPNSLIGLAFHNHPQENILHAGNTVGPGQTHDLNADDYIDISTDQTLFTSGYRWVYVIVKYDPSPWTYAKWYSNLYEHEIDFEYSGGYPGNG